MSDGVAAACHAPERPPQPPWSMHTLRGVPGHLVVSFDLKSVVAALFPEWSASVRYAFAE